MPMKDFRYWLIELKTIMDYDVHKAKRRVKNMIRELELTELKE